MKHTKRKTKNKPQTAKLTTIFSKAATEVIKKINQLMTSFHNKIEDLLNLLDNREKATIKNENKT